MSPVPAKLLTALIAAMVVLACPALAEARQVPHGFLAAMYDGPSLHSPPRVTERQFDLMATSGVESTRFVFIWELMQKTPGAEFNFDRTDKFVERATKRGIEVLPVMLYAPPWARVFPKRLYSPPRIKPYREYLRASIERYGSRGSFWEDNPDLPKRPIRDWQVWNEPRIRDFWDVSKANERYGWPEGYARLLKAANRTIKATDPRARTVLGGLNGKAWKELKRLYDAGAGDAFDVMAVHIYAQTEQRALGVLDLTRKVMNRAGDRRKPMFVTETAFPASRGRAEPINGQRQETPRGMARRLTRLYSLMARAHRRLKLERVTWYTWSSSYREGKSNFEFAGLVASEDGVEFTPQPALKAFRRIARRLQGCAQDTQGDCRSR